MYYPCIYPFTYATYLYPYTYAAYILMLPMYILMYLYYLHIYPYTYATYVYTHVPMLPIHPYADVLYYHIPRVTILPIAWYKPLCGPCSILLPSVIPSLANYAVVTINGTTKSLPLR